MAFIQPTSEFEYPATSLTGSAWRDVAVFSLIHPEMRLHRGLGNAQRLHDLGNAADFNDGEQHAKFVGVSLYALAITSGGDGGSFAALWMNTAATAL